MPEQRFWNEFLVADDDTLLLTAFHQTGCVTNIDNAEIIAVLAYLQANLTGDLPNILHPQARFIGVPVSIEYNTKNVRKDYSRIRLQTENLLQRTKILIEQLSAAGIDQISIRVQHGKDMLHRLRPVVQKFVEEEQHFFHVREQIFFRLW